MFIINETLAIDLMFEFFNLFQLESKKTGLWTNLN